MKFSDYLYQERWLLYLCGLLLIGLMLVSPATAAFSGSGAGTSGDPYQITNTSQWNEMNDAKSSYYILNNNLDWAGGSPNIISAEFTGQLNGNNKIIKNIVLPSTDAAGETAVGLFARLAGNGGDQSVVKDLTLSNVDWSGNPSGSQGTYIGFVAARTTRASIQRVFVDKDCSITVSGTGNTYICRVGGIVGWPNGRTESPGTAITDCGVAGTISTSDEKSKLYLGGIAGDMSNGDGWVEILRCWNAGLLTMSGGHASTNHGAITYSGNTVTNSYFDNTINLDVGQGTGASTANMKTSGYFSGWTYDSTHWKMSNSGGGFSGYPIYYTTADIIPAPTAAFSMGWPNLYTGNATRTMSDDSTGTPTSWLWQFGDGTSNSTLSDPEHTFAEPATTTTYTVRLTATNAGGSTSVSHDYVYYRAPSANFAANKTSFIAGGANDIVAFTDSTTNTPTSWSWTFGDSGSSTSQNPTHEYTTSSQTLRTVSLTVTNPAGTSTLSKSGYIFGHYPLGSLTLQSPASTTYVSTGANVYFKAYPNPDYGDGYIVAQDFIVITTDGVTTDLSSSTRDAYHHFDASGLYDASFGYQDWDGDWKWTNTTGDRIHVSGTVTANFTMSPTSGNIPLEVDFTDISSGGTFDSAAWNFGDGYTSTDRNPTHTYTVAGTYSPSLIWTNSAAASGYITRSITVGTPAAPSADWSSNVSSGNYPLTVAFTATTTGGTAPITHAWSFGDNGTSTSANPTHQFALSGVYTVRLTETDANSRVSYHDGTITVTNPTAPTAGFSMNQSTGIYPLSVLFTDTTSGGIAPYTYAWTFGDSGTSTSTNPVHTYASPGSYTIVQTVTDSYLHTGVFSDSVVVGTPANPTVSFTPNKTSDYYPFDISFADDTTGGMPPYTYSWLFGDGGTSTDENPTHTYTTGGYYSVTESVTDSYSHTSFYQTIINSMQVGSPNTLFSMNVSIGNAPMTVAFTDQTTGSPTQWNWSFGDGSSVVTTKNAVHTYAAAGDYSVVLTTLTSGGTSALTQPLRVLPTIPVAAFTFAPATGAAPLAVAFTGSSTPTATSWSWNFGDGTAASTAQSPTHTFTAGGTYTVILSATNSGGTGTISHPIVITAPTSIVVAPVTTNPVANAGEIVVYPLYNISTTSEPEVAIGSQLVIDANTTGITTFVASGNTYNIDGWQVVWDCVLYIPPGTARPDTFHYTQDGFPAAWPVNAATNRTYTYTVPARFQASSTWEVNDYTDNATFTLYAVNNSAPNIGYGQGKYKQNETTLKFSYVPPTLDWAWGTMSRSPAPGELLESIISHNSMVGLLAQQTLIVETDYSTDAKDVDDATKVWTVYPGYPINPAHTDDANPQGITFLDYPASYMDLRTRYCYEQDYTEYYKVYGAYQYVTVLTPTAEGSFLWKNIAGGTVTSAVDTDTIKWGLDTGNSWETINYPTLSIMYYKYNVATGIWDALSTPAPVSMTWGAQTLKTSGQIDLSTLFTSTDSQVKLRAVVRGVAVGGSDIIVTSSDLTIRRNAISPSNIGNAAGGWMGLDPGLGGILLGTILSVIIACLAFVLVRDARVFLVGGLAGVTISFALGLYPIWLIVVIGIAGVAALLFASGVLGGRGEGGTPPVEG